MTRQTRNVIRAMRTEPIINVNVVFDIFLRLSSELSTHNIIKTTILLLLGSSDDDPFAFVTQITTLTRSIINNNNLHALSPVRVRQ